MFEWKIQKGWDEYSRDYGLGRIVLTTCFFNTFLLAIGVFSFGGIVHETMYPIIISLVFFFLRDKIVKFSPWQIFAINVVPVTVAIIFNYYIVGLYDQLGQYERYDRIFMGFDLQTFGGHIAVLWVKNTQFLGWFQSLYYDLLQVSYMTYYLFPSLGAIFYFKQLSKNNKFKISRFFISVVVYFNLNYFLYLLVPVSGPQYSVESVKSLSLPLGSLGFFINRLVFESHPNFIDCFPSGHTGISILVTIWMFKIKNHYRYVFLFFALMMIQATLALKYHYSLDVITAVPFAVICYITAYKLVPASLDIRENRKWRF